MDLALAVTAFGQLGEPMKTFLKFISIPFRIAFVAGAALLTAMALVTVLAAILTIATSLTSGADAYAAYIAAVTWSGISG
jgi:hypothetical protein